MALDPNRWTLKTQEAFSAAVDAAKQASNPEVTPDHLLAALLGQGEGVVLPMLQRLGKEPLPLRNQVNEALAKLPKAYGSEARLSRELNQVFDAADAARAELTDEYLSTEHLLLALADRLGVTRDDVLAAMQAVRGSHRVTSQNPEDQFQALEKYGRDLTEAARQGKLDPVIGRDEEIRRVIQVLSPPHQEQPRAHRRARRRQDRHRRGAGPPHRRGRRARDAEEQAGHRARPRLDGRRRQVPRRVRGAAQGGAQGDHRRRGRGHHLHRRAAHDRRRRRGRGGDGRRQHAQADAGPRRAAHDRRHHARRVPQAHREGRRPRAPLPAGVRRAAVRRGHHRHPARAQGALRGPPRRAHPGRRARGRRRAVRPLPHRALPARQGHRPRRRGRVAACASRSTRCPPRSTSSSGASASSRSSGWRWPRRPTQASTERLAGTRRGAGQPARAARRDEGPLAEREGGHRRDPRAQGAARGAPGRGRARDRPRAGGRDPLRPHPRARAPGRRGHGPPRRAAGRTASAC